jgi:serine/threonine-protein kinase RsbW
MTGLMHVGVGNTGRHDVPFVSRPVGSPVVLVAATRRYGDVELWARSTVDPSGDLEERVVAEDDPDVIHEIDDVIIDDVIEVRVPARPEFGSFLRLAVASVAADLGFTVDEIDDLRLGVSEIFGALADSADEGDCCAMRVAIGQGAVAITLRAEDPSGRLSRGGPETPALDALSATILASVVDEFRSTDDGFVVVKRAVESAAAG